MIGPFKLNHVHAGDAIEMLRRMPDESVQCCVTSPPYWNLRDYQTGQWEGGNAACDHAQPRGGQGEASSKQITSGGTQTYQYAQECPKCGAKRIDKQLGLEITPQEYIQTMTSIFEEVRRVLRQDGTCWINIGDSYAGSGKGIGSDYGKRVYTDDDIQPTDWKCIGIPAKNLIGIPWRLAFSLQAAGWYLRADIIWSKSNPMPESVTDRPTKSHEYLFLLAKSERYYYDAEAVKEKMVDESDWEYRQRIRAGKQYNLKEPYKDNMPGTKIKKVPAGWQQGTRGEEWMKANGRTDKQRGHGRRHAGFNDRWDGMTKAEQQSNGRNRRSVWEIATMPYSGAHFATYPKALVEPCILAGTRPGDIVLDPFAGSGTTGVVAIDHGRKFIGFDLNKKYCQELAAPRLAAAEREQTVEQYQAGQLTIFDTIQKQEG